MFTHKDVETRSIFVINCMDKERALRVKDGELFLEEKRNGENATLTKFPFQKLLALFVVGHITVTTPLIDKCKKFNVALIVVKFNFRPVFYWHDSAEANYLLRQRQFEYANDDLSIAKILVENKIQNQLHNLQKTRKKDDLTLKACEICLSMLTKLNDVNDIQQLLSVEGYAAKIYFSAYFQSLDWKGRRPRMKCDVLNVILDIGYSILFNFIECFVRMFGFDIYIGVYHRLWFKRKSLICDLVEPFRCIIDHSILMAFHRKQFREEDFECKQHVFYLKRERANDYYKVFLSVLIEYKLDVFRYVQSYYRCFMGKKSVGQYPNFVFK